MDWRDLVASQQLAANERDVPRLLRRNARGKQRDILVAHRW